MNNTKPMFYFAWSREQLISELVRMNKLLDEMDSILEAAK